MNRLLTAALLAPVLLAGCGAAKLNGPLTQDKLDEIQGECGMSGAMLLAVEPDGTATISTGSVNMEGPEAEAIDMIYKSKCLKERLDALGVKHAVSVEMQSPQFQREIERGLQNM